LNRNLLYLLLQVFSWHVFGQENPILAQAKPEPNSDKVTVNREVEIKKVDKYLQPIIGKNQKTDRDKLIDKQFIDMCRKNFPNLNEASKFFADRGWEYLGETELDTAMHRFSLCYLLNQENVDAYWGAGVICFQKGDYDNAKIALDKGFQIDSTNASLLVDLATVEIVGYEKNNNSESLMVAHNHLAKAIDIDPLNILAWLKRSETEYYLENYENSWDCIHSARLLDISKIDLSFVEKLNGKLKDPKGLFRFD
jgi:tetratricopeptide (TPR) repeat protein